MSDKKIKINLLSDLAKVPTAGSKLAAGYDLYAATNKKIMIPPHETRKISTDIAIEIPNGWFGGIYPRSGIATKRGLRMANTVGVIDSDYRGPIIIALHNDFDTPQVIEAGERIAQLIIQPFYSFEWDIADNLSNTERGNGGFGSSGTN